MILKPVKNILLFMHRLTDFQWHKSTYRYILYLNYFLYFIAVTGIFAFEPEYLTIFNDLIKYYIGLFLIVRYNPIVSINKITTFDKEIVFSAAIFILLTTAVATLSQRYIERNIKNIKNIVKNNEFKNNHSV